MTATVVMVPVAEILEMKGGVLSCAGSEQKIPGYLIVIRIGGQVCFRKTEETQTCFRVAEDSILRGDCPDTGKSLKEILEEEGKEYCLSLSMKRFTQVTKTTIHSSDFM